MEDYKLIIAGSRNFTNYDQLREIIDRVRAHLNKKEKELVVVSGTARGADKLGERYAREHNLKIEAYPADWKEYGKSAGFKRNSDMSKAANGLVAFWDNKSNGTRHMIKKMKTNRKPTLIIKTNSQGDCHAYEAHPNNTIDHTSGVHHNHENA